MRTDYPEMGAVSDTSPEEYLISFYQTIGWDRQSELDPEKILLNPDHWKDICAEFNKSDSGPIAGLLWVNYGPSTSEKVPYGKVEIEEGAFNRSGPMLTKADKASLDESVNYLFYTEGNVAHLEADVGESNEFLLQSAYDAQNLSPEVFLETLHDDIAANWEEGIDIAIDNVLENAGIIPYADKRYDIARNYLIENYTFEPPYSHYLDQEMKVNILLGTETEQNLDFSSISTMRDEGLGSLDEEVCDNALTWLVNQQGHTLGELQDAMAVYQKWGFDAAEITHGTFLASVAEEMNNFSNTMGTVTVLSSISMHDMAKLMDSNTSLTVPANATVGIFAPWVGGGSTLDIQLEKELVIPFDKRFEMQIEGADCNEYTVNSVYGLVEEAWKKPVDISSPVREFNREKPLDDLVKEAKTKAADKNIGRSDFIQTKQPPEMGL